MTRRYGQDATELLRDRRICEVGCNKAIAASLNLNIVIVRQIKDTLLGTDDAARAGGGGGGCSNEVAT